jgi:hypothetical protein
MLPLDEVEGWLMDAGFVVTERRRILRSKKLDLADEERNLLVEFRGRYSFIPEQERAAGLRLMRAEAKASGADWSDSRPTSFIVASKTGSLLRNLSFLKPGRAVHALLEITGPPAPMLAVLP